MDLFRAFSIHDLVEDHKFLFLSAFIGCSHDFQAFERKLAAILSANVVGYSRLMSEDDMATVGTLQIRSCYGRCRVETVLVRMQMARGRGDNRAFEVGRD